MSRNKKSILIVLVILLAALGIYFLFKDDHHEKRISLRMAMS